MELIGQFIGSVGRLVSKQHVSCPQECRRGRWEWIEDDLFGVSVEIGNLISPHLATLDVQHELAPRLATAREVNVSLIVSWVDNRGSHEEFSNKDLSLHHFLLIGLLIIEEFENNGTVVAASALLRQVNSV